MSKFSELDFYLLDADLPEESRMLKETVRSFVDQEVIPLLQKANREEKFPLELIPRFGEMGLLGSNLTGYGLPGLDALSYGLLMQELERADSGIRSFCSVQGSLVMWPIFAYGTEEQKQKYLPALGKGEMVGCFGLTEPDFGSNPAGMITEATEVKDGYVLNGNKMWITNGSLADVAVVWAKLAGEVRGFLVDRGTKGFSTTLTEGKFSLRVSVTSELHFDNCKIPKENLLPKVKGLKGPLGCLSQARYGISFGVVGAAQAVFNEALTYAQERIIFGKPQASFQLIQAKLAHMAQEITKAQLLCRQLAHLKTQGTLRPHHISLAKMNNTKMALDCARTARDMLGANGIVDEYCVIRHMMNLETVNTYEGTEDIHRLVVGKELTGIQAFY